MPVARSVRIGKSQRDRIGKSGLKGVAPCVARRVLPRQIDTSSENLAALASWISQEKKNGGRRLTPHISWSDVKPLYKFIEHMLKKSRTGVMPFSHAERLKGLDATWGQQRRTLAELFWSS